MSNLPISGLTPGAAVSDTDVLPNVQVTGFGPVKTTALQIKNYTNASPTITGTATFSAGANFGGSISTNGISNAGNITTTNMTVSATATFGNVSANSVSINALNVAGAISGASLSTSGNVSCLNLTASSAVAAATLSASGSITGASSAISGNVSCANLNATGNVAATGSVSGASVSTTGNISCVDMNASGAATVGTNLTVSGNSYTTGNVGVGTTSPTTQIDSINNSASTNNIVRAYNANTTSSSLAGFKAETGQGVDARLYSTNGVGTVGTISNHPLNVVANNATAMTVAASGNVGVGNTSPGVLMSVGRAGGSNGALGLYGSTSGVVTVSPQAAAGTYNFNLPTTSGSAGQFLTSGGGGSAPMTWTSLPTSEPVSVLLYGADNTGATNCASAFAAANSAAPNILIPSGTYLVSSNVTFTKNVTILAGAVLNIATGVTVTFNAGMQADRYQIFNITGTGAVVFDEEYLTVGYPEWWGAVADNNTVDCSTAINRCIVACPTTQLGVGYYFISSTVKLQKTGRALVGHAYGYGTDATYMTTIVTQSPTITLVQLGPDADPGVINNYLQGVSISNFSLGRTVGPSSTSGSGLGVVIRFTLFAQAKTINASENTIGYYIYATVQTRLTDCYSSRTLAKSTGAPADQFIGFYLDGSSTIPAAGGNASTYFTDCGTGCFLPALQSSGSKGLSLDKAGADTFVLRFEAVTCAIGIELIGSIGTSKAVTGDVDIHFINCIIDQFATWGIRISNCTGSAAIDVIGCYFAPTSGSGATAGIGIDTCYGLISLTNNQVIGWPNTGMIGLYITSGFNVATNGNMYVDCRNGAIFINSSANCRIQDACRAQTVVSPTNAVTITGSSNRTYIAPIISGGATYWSNGVRVDTSCSYVEVNVTAIDPSSINGGAGDKLLYGTTQVTTVGTFGGTNYCSGCVG